MTLHISALVEVRFGFIQNSLNFGRLRKGDTVTRTAVLILKDMSKRNLLEFTSQSPFLTIKEVASSSDTAKRIPIAVTLHADAPPGRLNTAVIVRLTDSSHQVSRLSINATIVGDIEITPATIRFTLDSAQDARTLAEQSVRVVSTRDNVSFQLLDVTDPQDRLSFTVDTVLAGKQYVIKARPNKTVLARGRMISGLVKVLTNSPDQPELTFRYFFVYPR